MTSPSLFSTTPIAQQSPSATLPPPEPAAAAQVAASHLPVDPPLPRANPNRVPHSATTPTPSPPGPKVTTAPPQTLAPWTPEPYGPPYLERADVRAFIKQTAGSDAAYAKQLTEAFAKIPQRMKPNPNAPPSGEDLPFDAYMNIFTKPGDIDRGVDFAKQHAATLALAHDRYGVDPQAILGILNVETKYGTHPDNIPVLNALVQRSWDSTRGDYFKSELVSFLKQARDNTWDIKTFMGSTAGAFGMPQFMPSNVPRYGVSAHPPAAPNMFDGDDAILSIGNFLQHAAGTPYRSGEPAAVELKGHIGTLRDKQSITAGALRARGLAVPASLADATKGVIFRYQPRAGGAERAMFLGPNATVLKSYNNDRTYAAATYLLGVMAYEKWQRGQ